MAVMPCRAVSETELVRQPIRRYGPRLRQVPLELERFVESQQRAVDPARHAPSGADLQRTHREVAKRAVIADHDRAAHSAGPQRISGCPIAPRACSQTSA